MWVSGSQVRKYPFILSLPLTEQVPADQDLPSSSVSDRPVPVCRAFTGVSEQICDFMDIVALALTHIVAVA